MWSIVVAVREESRAADTVAALRAHPAAPRVVVASLPGGQRSSRPYLGAAGSPVDVVVSTIPAAAQSPELVERCAAVPVVFEVLYDPWPTPLAASVAASVGDDRVLVSGLDLLAHQAVLQFELFTGRSVPVDVLRDAGIRELEARRAVG